MVLPENAPLPAPVTAIRKESPISKIKDLIIRLTSKPKEWERTQNPVHGDGDEIISHLFDNLSS